MKRKNPTFIKNERLKSAGLVNATCASIKRTVNIPFVFSSNGDGLLLHDRTATTEGTVETELGLDDFPTPAALWARYKLAKGLTSPVAARLAEQLLATALREALAPPR